LAGIVNPDLKVEQELRVRRIAIKKSNFLKSIA
jgi:hypothetical protein